MNKQTSIYILYDPTFKSKKVYVGKSIQPIIRLQQHTNKNNLNHNTKKNSWIKSLATRAVLPQMFIVSMINNEDNWKMAEHSLITFLRYIGIELVNDTDGGEGATGRKVSSATKKKISDKKLEHSLVKPGAIFGRLTVIRWLFKNNNKHIWECLCICGKLKITEARRLTGKNVRSCGCLRKELASVRASASNKGKKLSKINRGAKARNKYGYKGIGKLSKNRFKASIMAGTKELYLGSFKTIEEAANAYDDAARIYFKEDAALNFPLPGEKSALID